MAKSNVSFSLGLLRKNKKLHYEQMRLMKGAKLKCVEYGVTKKSVLSEIDKQYNYHKKLHNDLVTAIKILSKKVKKQNRVSKPTFTEADCYRFA